MISYHRIAHEELLQALEQGGWAHSLVDFSKSSGYSLDLQIRGYGSKSKETWATLYVGLTKVLDLRHLPKDRFRLRVHSTWGTAKNGWSSSWDREWNSAAWFKNEWSAVDMYLEHVIPSIQKQFLVEGAVQAAVCGFKHRNMVMIDREAAVTYTDQAEKSRVKGKLERELLAAVRRPDPKGWRAVVPKSLGGECDALAIGRDGTLLAIEIKPRSATSTIRWSPVQARNYADLFTEWIEENGDDKAKVIIEKMVEQRVRLGLIPAQKVRVTTPIRVQPVIVIGRGYSQAAIDGLREVQERLAEAGKDDPPLLLRSTTMWGRLDEIEK